ncbi:MAG TPA: aconitate hydratase AcnA, partial [Planctomycetaceae bacterium]|nr:aconitate hydratase AcnA [Planctomycetaceae bacterium]
MSNPFNALRSLSVEGESYSYYRLDTLGDVSRLPFSIRVLLESLLRNHDGFAITEADVRNLAAWGTREAKPEAAVPFKPARVLLQDFTGVPAVVDLAAMRAAMKRLGGDPRRINPLIPVDLVIDHSVQTDYYGSADAAQKNVAIEFQRNAERYALLHWAQKSFDNFEVVPPSTGIIHQINLEYLAKVVIRAGNGEKKNVASDDKEANIPSSRLPLLYPDSVVGTDSHTVMINGLGVLGWGVGGIEAEAVMLGQPYYMTAPEVIGVELVGKLPTGTNATDLVLAMTQLLRKEGVVGKFVEYFGAGARSMSGGDRAVLANMGPEYGATMGFFPVDERTIEFLKETGRPSHQIAVVEAYCRANSLFADASGPIPRYTNVLTFDLSGVEPSLAGPKRPQDRIPLTAMKESFHKALTAPVKDRGFAVPPEKVDAQVEIGPDSTLRHGSVVIAAITSCTNTSNPHLMIAAGLLARNAVAKGLKVKPFVKTSLGPGSRVVEDYLRKAGLLAPLEQLGFDIVGFGCLTCIGNSGPLPEPVAKAVAENDLVVAAVLSGNRNFEGRINPLVKANYLAGPPLVVAYALAGHIDADMDVEPLGIGSDGTPVYLRDIRPGEAEIDAVVKQAVEPRMYAERYTGFYEANPDWNAIPTTPSNLFPFDPDSTYIQEPPFLLDMRFTAKEPEPIDDARCLIALGDSTTTDHISPAGAIKTDSPAGAYLRERGVEPDDFNSYGSRRGNDRVMTRGTFANIRIRNLLVPGSEGGVTIHFPTG